MNQRDDDLNVPDLGPAESDRAAVRAETPRVQGGKRSASASAGGGGFITSLILIILVVAVTVLGYFGFDLYQQQQAREVAFTLAQQQIAELRELLKVAEKGAEQSGQTLSGRLQQLEKSHTEKTKQLDSEVAKLWAVAYQKNKPRLDEQEKSIAGLEKGLKQQAGTMDQQSKALTAQEKTIKSLQSQLGGYADQFKVLGDLKKQQTALEARVGQKETEISKLVARLEAQLAATTELLQEQIDQLKAGQKQLAASSSKDNTAELERRLRLNEQSVRAFDSTRQQLNQELLQVKQKLNNLQLLIESRG